MKSKKPITTLKGALWHSFWHDQQYFWALIWAGWEFKYGILCGKIGEWFLWQEWKQCTDREEFEADIRRLRGVEKYSEYLEEKNNDN